jgi:hypothetical protein
MDMNRSAVLAILSTLRCWLGIHDLPEQDALDERDPWDATQTCRRCGERVRRTW